MKQAMHANHIRRAMFNGCGRIRKNQILYTMKIVARNTSSTMAFPPFSLCHLYLFQLALHKDVWEIVLEVSA